MLQFNFLNASGASPAPSSAFVYDDPNAWTPPLNDPTDIAAGQTLYQSATLLQSSLSGAPTLTAHCADCHTLDGHDLKYFNYSNFSIEARAQFHGLNATQGQQIASYIRSLTFPNPGRPWNPPYQPAANIDTLPISSWAAGGGIESVLPEDADALSYLFPNGISANGNALNTSQNVNMRTLPTEFMLPDWNHWLPRVHPKDAAALNAAAVAAGETTFVNSTVNHYYNGEGTGSSAVIMSYLSSGLTSSIQNGTVSYLLNDWADKMMLYVEPIGTPTPPGGGWTPAHSLQVYGLMQWKQVKMWDVMTTFGLGGKRAVFLWRNFFQSDVVGERATWPTGETFKVGPAAQFIPTTDNNFTTSLADYEYLDNAWYALQSVLNAGNRERSGNSPIDWAYVYNRLINDLQGASQNSQLPGGWPEMTRLVSLIAKGMQQNDGTSQLPPGNDYANIANGWAPRATGDISLLVHPGFTNLWNGVDSNTKRQVLNAITKVWFSKMQQYTPAQYYSATWDTASGPPSPTEVETGNLGGSLLDKIFGMIPYLRSAGVDNALLNNICDWGATVFPAPGNDWASLKVAINPDVTSGLVGRWTFDEGFGTNVVDWSDAGIYTGVMQGTTLPAWVTTGQPVGYGCLAFNSANATQVSVTNWPSLGLGGSMTLSAWIKFNSVPAPGASSMIVSTKNSSGDAAGYQFYYNPNDGTLDFSGAGSLLAIAPATIGDTSWHHVVVTVSGTAVQIYKDGAALTMSAGYNTCGSLVSSSNPLVIGSGLNGQLDDVRVYNRGLSATEISTLYNVDQ